MQRGFDVSHETDLPPRPLPVDEAWKRLLLRLELAVDIVKHPKKLRSIAAADELREIVALAQRSSEMARARIEK